MLSNSSLERFDWAASAQIWQHYVIFNLILLFVRIMLGRWNQVISRVVSVCVLLHQPGIKIPSKNSYLKFRNLNYCSFIFPANFLKNRFIAFSMINRLASCCSRHTLIQITQYYIQLGRGIAFISYSARYGRK